MNTEDEDDMKDTLSNINSFNINSECNSYCEECSLPLADYGYVPILIFGENDKFFFREFCDLCAANYFGEEFCSETVLFFTENLQYSAVEAMNF